jgi:CelD/BcsL family acetyltransferase involved in cellulose biosynthesis
MKITSLQRRQLASSQITFSGSAPVQICVARHVQSFAEFWPRWNTLGEARCYPFQCADILELYCDTFIPSRNGEPLFVAILGCEGEPLMLIPLVIQSYSDYTRIVKNVRILKFLDFWFADYNAPVVFPPVANWDTKNVRTIWRGLQKLLPSFDIAMFEKMPERVGDLPNPLSLLKTASDPYTGHAAHLSGGWEDFASRLPNRKRWRTRRFRELGERSLALAKTPEEYDVFIETLLRQKRERHPLFATVPDEAAYLKMARRLVYPAGPVCLFALKVDDTVIATEFCLLRERWIIGQLLSYEHSWRTYAPGHLVNTMVCEWCFANGIQILDFGIGAYSYKKEYCDVIIKLWQAKLPANMKGRLASSWRATADWTRMWRVKLYISAQSLLHRHPKLRNSLRSLYLYRTLPPLLFDFGREYIDRQYMRKNILPALAAAKIQRVLFVGCQVYTARYGKQLTQAAIDYWTTDIEPGAAIWGERDHHIVGNIAQIDNVCAAESFDVVLLNGVFGHGVDDESEMNQSITAIARILRPSGKLLIGWNSLKNHPDPIRLKAVTTHFRHDSVLSLPARKTFLNTDHVYDWLIKTSVREANEPVRTTGG